MCPVQVIHTLALIKKIAPYITHFLHYSYQMSNMQKYQNNHIYYFLPCTPSPKNHTIHHLHNPPCQNFGWSYSPWHASSTLACSRSYSRHRKFHGKSLWLYPPSQLLICPTNLQGLPMIHWNQVTNTLPPLYTGHLKRLVLNPSLSSLRKQTPSIKSASPYESLSWTSSRSREV